MIARMCRNVKARVDHFMRSALAIVSSWTLLTLEGCGPYQPPRPANVRPGAVATPGPKGTAIWQQCQFTTQGQIRCERFNGKGQLFFNDLFIPYRDGKMPTTPTELKILPKGGADWVILENGTILIPESQKDGVTKFLDYREELRRILEDREKQR
jgi:hypothetical protein